MSDRNAFIERMLKNRPAFLDMLGCEFSDLDSSAGALTNSFTIGLELCHSGDVIQGGFSTAMLDATMSHAVYALDSTVKSFSSLEIKVTFMAPARAGKLRCVGKVDRIGGSIAFLSGELYNEQEELVCTATSTAKISR